MALVEETGAVAPSDDPEALLNEWLGELTVLTAGLNSPSDAASTIRPLEIVAPRIDTYRFSMANLEETQDADLDDILTDLNALDSQFVQMISKVSAKRKRSADTRNQENESGDASNVTRTESPDNDSAFSDTVSMFSGESSASSAPSSKCKALKLKRHQTQKDASFQLKSDKIKLALERLREANIKKLFIKAFCMDGSSKSLLVDEKMTCGYVTRLLADKNHLIMEPKWAIVEHLPELHMERIYEDHEMLVDNLMLWTWESKNKILFAERSDKVSLFQTPEKFLLTQDDLGWSSEHDEHLRQVIIEEFFGAASAGTSVSGHQVPPIEGPLYLKHDAKKGWKKIYCVLRPSGLYYTPKDKVKTVNELVCLATFDINEVYTGFNWKKKYKSPTDYGFAIKHPRLQQPKSIKFIKFLCADDKQTMERWVTAIRIAKHGRQLVDNHRSLVEDLTQEDLDHLAHARSCSITSIPTKTSRAVPSGRVKPAAKSNSSNASVANSDISSGRNSRASSSSSSGCLSDGGTASESTFDCEYPMGTIKRKPLLLKPNLPLTWMTRQLKEMVEKVGEEPEEEEGGDSGTLTRRPRSRRADDSTLKKRHHVSIESSERAANSDASSGRSSALSNPARREPVSPTYRQFADVSPEHSYRNSNSDSGSMLYGYSSVYDTIQRAPHTATTPMVSNYELDILPPPPPAEDLPDGMFSSTLSLDYLPPPPPPLPLEGAEEPSGSWYNMPPPPPGNTVAAIVSKLTAERNQRASRAGQPRSTARFAVSASTFPRHLSADSVASEGSRSSSMHSDRSLKSQQNVAFGACLAELQAKKLGNGGTSILKKLAAEPADQRPSSMKKVNDANEPRTDNKKTKKITFNLKEPPPSSPRKPLPPKRYESTRLSSLPKKLTDSNSNPPTEFLQDLQRVMSKKWQVAQKCKLELATAPHEVLGFREYPLSEDYKETSVSMWVQEHYGAGAEGPFYQKAAGREEARAFGKRLPPAPPRRSDSTHLSTHPPPVQREHAHAHAHEHAHARSHAQPTV